MHNSSSFVRPRHSCRIGVLSHKAAPSPGASAKLYDHRDQEQMEPHQNSSNSTNCRDESLGLKLR